MLSVVERLIRFIRQLKPVSEPDIVFEMANLPEIRTGVRGFIYISTYQGQHGPRVKYFTILGKNKDSFSVNIHTLEITGDSLGKKASPQIRNQVKEFVRKNQTELIDFWNNGMYRTVDEVNECIHRLKPVS